MSDNYWDKLSGDDEHAAEYMLTYGEGPGTLTRMVLSSFINDGESVLDVGCGPGWNLEHFADNGPDIDKYKGLDYSQRFVRVANQRAVSTKVDGGGFLKRLRLEDRWSDLATLFEVGDVRDIHEADESWDVVIMQDVLEHTNGYEKPIQEALRVARKRVIIAFWHLMTKEEDNPINDDGDDGWGAWYSGPKFEQHLDSLDLHWMHHQIIDHQGKPRDFYIIDKQEPHGE